MTDTESDINEGQQSEGEGEASSPAEESVAPAIAEERAPRPLSVFEMPQGIGVRPMPTLDYIHDRFAAAARGVLLNLIRRPVEISAEPFRVCPFADVMGAAKGSPHITLVKAHPLRGTVGWVVSGTLVHLVVDTLFGGDRRLPPKPIERDLSATELRILRRMMDGLMVEYEKAWQPVEPLRFEYLREESSFARADIADPSDLVLQCAFKVTLNGHEAHLDFCVPYWLLDSIKPLLCEPTRKLQAEIDTHWTERLEAEVQSAEVELVAVLAREEMRIADVLALNVGDIVPIEVMEPITAYVDGMPMVLGQYGVRNGRYAIKVSHVKHPSQLLDKASRR
ncbi:MAG: hypothetical protein RIR70_1158 [Pseudomonadota bacterium]|jgi:flagellar motor switch protein FliM